MSRDAVRATDEARAGAKQMGQPSSNGSARAVGSWGIDRPFAFTSLLAIGLLDSAARGASLTFIPFLLGAKGLEPAAYGLYLTVLFTAGAAGKFICGPLAARFGNVATIVLTEAITAGGLLALLPASTAFTLALMLPLGFALNGTSSVLYATVADLVHASRRGRGYGIYYTGVEGASSIAPIVYGLLADRAGLPWTFVTMAAVTLLIIPLALATGRVLRS